MSDKIFLCDLIDIDEQGSKGFTVETRSGVLPIFLVRHGAAVRGYINRCPHTGVNLDWTPDQFLDITGKLIQCATHGALFRIDNGLCTFGPCAGDSLTPVSLEITETKIYFIP